ncbi:MAG TPA: YdcF family protein [Dongiaceae bacterium]|nr:YdcF family protein [Dongiaceae bacterium]
MAAVAFCLPQKILCIDSGTARADVIVVLGGGAHERPERAAELFKEHDAPRIVVSGFGDDEISRRILNGAGVPANVIQLESKSRTTEENAEFTIKLLREQKLKSAIIVTSWYHSRRALKTFGHFAPEIKFYSRPSYFAFNRADWTRAFAKRVYLEYAKLPGYWIRYGASPF